MALNATIKEYHNKIKNFQNNFKAKIKLFFNKIKEQWILISEILQLPELKNSIVNMEKIDTSTLKYSMRVLISVLSGIALISFHIVLTPVSIILFMTSGDFLVNAFKSLSIVGQYQLKIEEIKKQQLEYFSQNEIKLIENLNEKIAECKRDIKSFIGIKYIELSTKNATLQKRLQSYADSKKYKSFILSQSSGWADHEVFIFWLEHVFIESINF